MLLYLEFSLLQLLKNSLEYILQKMTAVAITVLAQGSYSDASFIGA